MALGARPELGEAIVTGDVVNTASRLAGGGAGGAVAVSEQTYRATERVFDYGALEPVAVKGKTECLSAVAAAAGACPFRLGRDPHAHDAARGQGVEKPLLDRDVRAGGAAAVVSAGDVRRRAGGGQEPARAGSCSATSRTGRASCAGGRGVACPTGRGSRSGRWGRSSRRSAGILESDSPEQAAAKLERACRRTIRIAPGCGRGWRRWSARRRSRRRRRSRLRPGGASARALAADGPTVLVFEDLHWADPALLAFLEHLADWAQGRAAARSVHGSAGAATSGIRRGRRGFVTRTRSTSHR